MESKITPTNPRGAGRKHLPPNIKKTPISLTIRPWLIKWLRANPKSNSSLIEEALVNWYKLKKPE